MVYRKTSDLLTRQVAGETLVVPVRGKLADMQKIFALSAVGERVWSLLDGTRSVEQLRDGVVEEFDVDPAAALADVSAFLGELLEAGLIEPA